MTWFQIIANESFVRPVFRVRDKLGTDFMVAFYTDNATDDARACQVGRVIAIKNARPHHFVDGNVGFRIEESSDVEVCAVFHLRLMAGSQHCRSSLARCLSFGVSIRTSRNVIKMGFL